jgi:hypothetical protein
VAVLQKLFLAILFGGINFPSLLCANNETNRSHTPSSYITQRVSNADLYVTAHNFKKGLTEK